MNNYGYPNNQIPPYNTPQPEQTLPSTPNIPLPQEITNDQGEKFIRTSKDTVIKDNGSLSSLSTKELLLQKYNEVMQDPQLRDQFNTLDPDSQTEYLINSVVTSYSKIHHLEQSSNTPESTNLKESATANVAYQNTDDMLINKELGIASNKYDQTKYTTITKETDDSIKINNNYNSNYDQLSKDTNYQQSDMQPTYYQPGTISQDNNYIIAQQSQQPQQSPNLPYQEYQPQNHFYQDQQQPQQPQQSPNLPYQEYQPQDHFYIANNESPYTQRDYQQEEQLSKTQEHTRTRKLALQKNFGRPGSFGYISICAITIITSAFIIGLSIGTIFFYLHK